jgi:uncharacterized membrane protein YgcG
MTDAPLTAAEACILLDPLYSSGAEAFKIAFLMLIAQGVIRISMADIVSPLSSARNFRSPVASVVRDPPPMVLAREIVDVIRRSEAARWGATLSVVAFNATKSYGKGLRKLKTRLILPELAARGLLAPRKETFLGVPVRTRYDDTPAGLGERRRIEAVLEDARRLPSLIGTRPDEAKAIVLAAGPLLLLVPELKDIYGQLAALDPAVRESVDGSDFSFLGGEAGSSGDQADMFDLGSFDMGALDLDFDAFDSSFDSSFSDGGDSGGDAGGGDGGGGDGGGGGE